MFTIGKLSPLLSSIYEYRGALFNSNDGARSRRQMLLDGEISLPLYSLPTYFSHATTLENMGTRRTISDRLCVSGQMLLSDGAERKLNQARRNTRDGVREGLKKILHDRPLPIVTEVEAYERFQVQVPDRSEMERRNEIASLLLLMTCGSMVDSSDGWIASERIPLHSGILLINTGYGGSSFPQEVFNLLHHLEGSPSEMDVFAVFLCNSENTAYTLSNEAASKAAEIHLQTNSPVIVGGWYDSELFPEGWVKRAVKDEGKELFGQVRDEMKILAASRQLLDFIKTE